MASSRTRGIKRPRQRRPEEKPSRLGLVTLIVMLLLLGAFLAVLERSRPHVTGDRLRLDSFVSLVQDGKINNATILDHDGYVIGRYVRPDGTVGDYNAPLPTGIAGQDFKVADLLVNNKVPTVIEQQVTKRIAGLVSFAIPMLMLIVLFAYLILSSRRGTGLFKVRSGARKIEADAGGVTFADVAGQDAAVAELREIKDFLADPKPYADLGAEIPKGVLLFGPPGCGKTLMARALAGEARASFYSISGSDFVELYVGVGAARVRDLFKTARENAPAVIFIDELDSIGRSRGGAAAVASQEHEQSLNQILAEMDGFSTEDAIIVLAATNRPDVLDAALLRPGRFDRHVGLERPDESARLAILSLHAAKKPLDPNVDLGRLAEKAVGLTGADLASVMNEGALFAARAGHVSVSQADLEQALQRILEAPERQRRLSMRDKSIGKRFADKDKLSFADVAGQDAAVAELREIREYLADPERYVAVGAKIPKGVLLYGPPGCGKTLMARALAGEANAAFISVGASEFVQKYVGEGAARVRDLFAEAKQMAPAIIFIDELDSLGRSRSGVAGDRMAAHGEQEQSLNQILAEMDGFSDTNGVIVLGATNRPDVLDPALLRPGRFDRTIALEFPNDKARMAILSLHAKDKVLDDRVNLAKIADRAHGLTGADMANIMNEGALLAARAGRTTISQAELEEALKRTIAAPERQKRLSLRSKSVGRRFSGEQRVTFADVAGVDDAVEELSDIKEFLAEPGRFADMGAVAPRGVLLSGPPGCGKTLLARAVAGEANAAFIATSATDFVEVWVGEGAARVRDLFAEARSMAPAILFIDELDAIGARRSSSSVNGGREVENTLNQILVELDGFDPRSAVIVMGATNRPDMLDPALVRPGRFDRKVDIAPPDRAGRRAILSLYAKDKPLAADVDLDALAGLTRGFSGADLHNIMNEATLLATRRREREVTMARVDEAIDRAYLGITSRTHFMTDEERRITAYHEAGHAIVARRLEGAVPPYKVTIVPKGDSFGHCTMADSHDRAAHSKSLLLARMAVSLGGYVAEQLVFGETDSGAATDLRNASEIARRMVCELGMSDELGAFVTFEGHGPDAHHLPAPVETTHAIRKLIQEAQRKAHDTLTANRAVLDEVAAALLEKETLTAADLEALMGTTPTRRRAANGATTNGAKRPASRPSRLRTPGA